ncbi:transcriptional regulator, TetR family [Pasteurella testudinis DSM 23072]|uniref:Transcriptional regulator, TetR family n=1 Tax=Pasteurella testudinis DSM 23072 TaxID=1122938 RepID=A0A1W1UER2_9PAST|nr:TetR/AcrR family transcriptional regulator [Pasteurella testudinis]SMB79595.1 transcriptional regulator, TetR family [Pasteurella testudinis DSM 23072]SUB50708.1 TetR family transcriptional regulator [Pasteurella testudinis]
MRHSEIETAQQILLATEKLMAEQGLHTLSMQKIAKAAGISVGTIYIYFKNKDELLSNLAKYLFARVDAQLSINHDPDAPLFDQYRQMWRNFWDFFNQNPHVLKNFYQYDSLPGFSELVKSCHKRQDPWNTFVKQGQKQRILCNLPNDVLFALSLGSAAKLAFRQAHYDESYADEVLETVIGKTWQSICN